MVMGEAFDAVLFAATAGDPEATRHLYDDLAPVVLGYLRGQGARDAEDLVNETFLDVFRGLDRFSGDEGGFRSWVFTIAHRRLVDARRRQGRRPSLRPLDDHDAVDASSPHDAVVAGELSPDLQGWLESLPALQRHVLLLREVGGLDVEEVAAVLGRSRGAVRSAHHRALSRLRERARRRNEVRRAHDAEERVTAEDATTITSLP